jgi:hypothetical protein
MILIQRFKGKCPKVNDWWRFAACVVQANYFKFAFCDVTTDKLRDITHYANV